MGPRDGPRRREPKPSGNAKKKQSKSLKKKIRDAERLLSKPDIPATVRVAQERMLDMMKESLKEKTVQEKELKLVKKYKKVKFFEKRKLMRKFKTCKKELETCSEEERKALNEQLDSIKRMWNYVVYYPSDMKYISLFPPAPYENLEVEQKQAAILETIAQKVKSGEIEDAANAILLSPKEKKPRPFVSRKKVTLGKTQSATEVSTENQDYESSAGPKKSVTHDDFFIDVTPSSLEEKDSDGKLAGGSVIEHKGSQYSLLGATSKTSFSTRKKKRAKLYDEGTAKKAKIR